MYDVSPILQEADTMPAKINGNSQYLIPVKGEDKPLKCTRATTVAKAPEDQSNLIQWNSRMVALGLGRRQDLLQMAQTIDPDNRRGLQEVVDLAFEAGGGTVKRNIGTAFHGAMEIVNRGGDPLPFYAETISEYQDLIMSYGLAPVPNLVERSVALTEYGVAGTFDLALTDGDKIYVADYKTGNVEYGASIAIQLAIYARADVLVSEDGTQPEDPPGFDQEVGIVIEAVAGQSPVRLHRVDLAAGWRGFKVAMDVREWRRTSKSVVAPW